MKAKVIETGEIIDVKCLYPTTYSRLDCNNKIIEEYTEDELEFEPRPKRVSLDKVCEWLEKNSHMYNTAECLNDRKMLIEDLRKEFE